MFLDVRDEYSGNVADWGRLDFKLPKITVRQLIHERVRLELERLAEFRQSDPQTVALTEDEKRLNGTKRPTALAGLLSDALSHSRQIDVAEKAFESNQYFILLDDRQAESLDEMIDVKRTSEVTFLLLTPLKGG